MPKAKRKVDVPVYSPLKLYKECNALFHNLVDVDYDLEKISKDKLINAMIVLRFYLKNIDDFKNVSSELFLKYLQCLLMQ
jgi:hypothetical protein